MLAEQVTDPVVHHGEGPVWSTSWGGLRWVDLLAGDVMSLDAEGVVTRRNVAEIVAAVRPRAGGGAVLGVERGFALEAPDGSITRLDPVWEDPSVRMNEGACDPQGRFYCGSMALDRRPGAGALHRLDPDGSVTTVLHEVTVSNGLAWAPDGGHAYYVDTETSRIDVFDHDPVGGISGRRPFVAIASADGRPDGLTVDADGGVWVALNGGGAVRRYSATGELDEVVEVPVADVTACTFGGERLDELYITTSRERLGPVDCPLTGSLFRAVVGAVGLPALEFAG